MMQSKRSLGTAATLLTLTIFVLAAGSAQSQSIRLNASIPFAFYAGEKLLPAGTYHLERYGSGFYRIFTQGEDSAFFGTISVSDLSSEHAAGKLIFHRYGKDYILSEMWWPGQSDGRKTLPTKIEREIATNAAPVHVQVAAQ